MQKHPSPASAGLRDYRRCGQLPKEPYEGAQSGNRPSRGDGSTTSSSEGERQMRIGEKGVRRRRQTGVVAGCWLAHGGVVRVVLSVSVS